MFEELEARATRAAMARADERKQALAAQLSEILPAGCSIETLEDGVAITGPGLARRTVLDASMRWTIAGLLK
jgi:hypothetical protein